MDSSRIKIWVRNAALGLVIIAFLLVFGQPTGSSISGVVAEVDGEPIRRDVFESFREQNASRSRDLLPADLDAAQVRQIIDAQTLQGLIQRLVLSQEAEALGLRVSDEELTQTLVRDPAYQRNGRFDPQIFEAAWRRAGFESDRVYTTEIRRDMLIHKLRRLISSPVRISDARVLEALERDRLRIRLLYAAARPADFAAGVELAEADVQGFVATQSARLAEAYDVRAAEFSQPEQVHARHILFMGSDAAERARGAHERLAAGDLFEALAAELSDDEATRNDGGNLGFFPRGRMLPRFEAAAFGLEPGETSEPVETERGVHLIRVEARQAAVERTLEDASAELARDLLRADRAREAARKVAETMLERLRAGEEFAALAAELGLSSATTPEFGPRDYSIPGIGNAPALQQG